jgi:uncharacterized membrane protein YdbT with pleckstrin-like domain
MTQQFKGQYDDEEVLFAFRKHPVVMRHGLVYAMIALLLGTIPSLIKPEMSYFWGGLTGGLILAIIVMFPSWVYWYFSVNIMTDQRFVQIVQKGFFRKRYSDIGIQQVQSVNYQVVGIQETLLGFGTVIIQTYLGDIVINDVHKPEEITKELSLILREHGSKTISQDGAAITSHDKIRKS